MNTTPSETIKNNISSVMLTPPIALLFFCLFVFVEFSWTTNMGNIYKTENNV